MLPSLVIILLLIVIYLNYNKKTDFTNQIINIALIVVVMSFTYSHLKKIQLMENSVESENVMEESSNNNRNIESFKNNSKKKHKSKNKNNSSSSNSNNNNDSANESDFKEFEDEDEYAEYMDQAQEITVRSPPYSQVEDNVSNFKNTTSPNKGESISQSELQGTANVFKPTLIVNDGANEKSVSYRMRNSDTPTNLISYKDYQKPVGNLYGEDGDDAENEETDPYYNESTNYGNNLLSNQRERSLGDDIINKTERSIRRARRFANKEEYEKQLQAIKENQRCMNIKTLEDRSCPYDVSEAEMATLNGKDKGKQYYPGYSFMPPETWNVPQKRAPSCIPDGWTKRPSAVFDRGTPTNVLELDTNGNMATNEDDVHFTNVGSILPKFKYEELNEIKN
tara:strand:- start:6422 stop:7606 length:1185 start_codon:yes stop_codon:yes gene_type:complete